MDEELMPASVLYDVLREAGTRLGAEYLRERDNDPGIDGAGERYRVRRRQLTDLIEAVDVKDKVAIRGLTAQLNAEIAELERNEAT